MKRRPVTQAMRLDWYDWQDRICPTCGVTTFGALMEWDHHLALIDGGTHDTDNLRLICIPCHRKKSAGEHIANCKAKRLASGGRKSKHPMPKMSEAIKAHNRAWKREQRARIKAERRA